MFFLFFFIFGAIVGSFLNVVIIRSYKGQSFLSGRSYCPKCRHKLSWYDNIPLLSFFILRGRCRYCHKKISWQYPLVEFMTGVLFVIVYYFTPNSKLLISNSQFPIPDLSLLLLLRNLFIVAVLAVVFVQDLRWYVVMDKIVLTSALIVFLVNIWLGYSLLNLLWGILIGGGFFLLQFVISQGRWIGGGDIRIGVFLGAAFGYPQVIVVLISAYFLGSLVAVFLLLARLKSWKSKLPLGVFLSPAAIVCLFWGEKIANWYLEKIVF